MSIIIRYNMIIFRNPVNFICDTRTLSGTFSNECEVAVQPGCNAKLRQNRSVAKKTATTANLHE